MVVSINETDGLNVTKLNLTVGYSGQSGASVDFYERGGVENETVYFAAPAVYLGRKMNSYGGRLNYTIYYSIGFSGRYFCAHVLKSLVFVEYCFGFE